MRFGGAVMTIAEIHGKLSPYEYMEDLLTSDVFSTFKYLDPNQGLVPFLKKAVSFAQQTELDFLENITAADYLFWPKTTYLNREPDVLIILTREDGSTVSILIEAKYTSGKHNLIREEANTDMESLDHIDGDQLAELYKELLEGNIYIENKETREKFKKSEGNRYLFYVTAHYAFPSKDMDETRNALKKKQYGNQSNCEFYWVNWMSILEVIEEVDAHETWEHAPTMRFLLKDLRDLLCRKGLVPFYGYSRLNVNVKEHEFYFWKEEESIGEESLFSKIDTRTVKRNEHSYFWEEEK